MFILPTDRSAAWVRAQRDGAHDTVNDWQTTTDVFLSVREDARDVDHGHLIRQLTGLLLLPALRSSLLLVASSSRQVSDVMVVPVPQGR